jgi:hypothetical protein
MVDRGRRRLGQGLGQDQFKLAAVEIGHELGHIGGRACRPVGFRDLRHD